MHGGVHGAHLRSQRYLTVLGLLLPAVFPLFSQTPAPGAPKGAAPQKAPAGAQPAPPAGVAALGRIEPEAGVLRVAAPYWNGRPSLVAELLVSEGERVQKDQLLAKLDGGPELDASVEQAVARIVVAQRALEQVREGPRPSDLRAQEAV